MPKTAEGGFRERCLPGIVVVAAEHPRERRRARLMDVYRSETYDKITVDGILFSLTIRQKMKGL